MLGPRFLGKGGAMRIATGLGALVFVVVAAPGCFLFGHKVSAEDCAKWGDQYEKTLKDEGEKAAKKCKGGKDKAFLKTANKQIAKNIKQSKDPLVEACKGTAGVLKVEKADDECFTKATSTEDWEKCKFTSTSALFIFGGTPEASRANWAGICASAGGGSGDDAEDDDDDDGDKKKKKKKGDDDDDDDKGGW
jgi:hypothetical protein